MKTLIMILGFLLLIGQISGQTNQWTFDENRGTTAFPTRGNVNGVLNNAQWRDLSKVGPGACVRITGADNSYVNFGGSVGQFGTQAFTVAFWVQTSDTLSLYDLLGDRTATGHGNFLAIRMTGGGVVSAEVDQDAQGTNYIGVQSTQSGLNDGNWHQIAVTRSGGTLNLYIDGAFSNSGSANGVANINNNNPLRFGRSLQAPGTSRFAPDALFDDLYIYNSALSSTRIRSLYNGATNQ